MTKYIYINAAKEKFYVIEEEYREFYREVDAKRKREQYHHRCVCPKEFIWKCDGDCDICEFHRSGDMCSMDYKNDEVLMDKVYEDAVMEDIIAYSMLLESMISKLCELDSDGVKIVETWKENPKASV